jgi:thymidylate synthase (methanogen type)
MKIPPTNLIHAIGLPDAWAQAVRYVMKNGLIIKTEYGPLSRDICSTIEILEPYLEPMLHPQFPTKDLHMKEYLKQWERDYDWEKQGFEYNYMDRLTKYPPGCKNSISEKWDSLETVDQIRAISEMISKDISRRQQAITWIPERDLFCKEDQPCLQRLWLRNLGDGNAELHCMWRSRDLYSAWNSNMVGLLTMIKREILEPNKLRLIKVVDFCNSLHIYEPDWEAALLVKPLPRSPQMMSR